MESQINKEELISIREYRADDKSFILATWLRGLRFGNEWFGLIGANTYYTIYHKILEAILSRPNSVIKVACLKDDESVILGYCIYAGTRLDWVFVKKAWRKIGIAKALVPTDIQEVSHLTKVGKSLLLKYPKLSFNPFIP